MQEIDDAVTALRGGHLCVLPTETVYGLGANALDAGAVRRIYDAKGRPSFNPLIVHVSDMTAAQQVIAAVPPAAQALAEAFWPGPLTLVLPRRPELPTAITAGLETVGVRAPSHPVARALLEAAGVPIAAPSANRYTRVSPTRAEHVLSQLRDRVDLVIDGGPCAVGIESTVIDVSGATPTILRPGSVSRAALEAVIGPVALVSAGGTPLGDAPRPSPGLVDRHYAPNARLHFVAAGAVDEAERTLRALRTSGRVGFVSHSAHMPEAHLTLRLPADPVGYAQALYDALHALDEAHCDAAVIERVPDGDAWEGVADRLRRAGSSHGNGDRR